MDRGKMKIAMVTRFAAVLALAAAPGFCADWNPRLAADSLDARQKEWFAWPAANGNGVTCVSCHTGMSYLLARPVLRRALGESGRTTYETGLLNGMKSRVAKQDLKELFPKTQGPHAAEALGVESIFSALFLAMEDAPGGKLSPDGEKAFARMWSLQKPGGEWDWNVFDLDPWETPDSIFYGATLAALATGTAPAGYQSRPDIRQNVAALTSYLRKEEAGQPLHNRLMLVWASTKLRDTLPDAKRAAVLEEVWQKQGPDGGWTMESLGAFKKHEGSNSYATGLVAFAVQQAGVARSNARLSRALDWLKAHQDQTLGAWAAASMNKRFPAESMQGRFMQDAATGFAALALLNE